MDWLHDPITGKTLGLLIFFVTFCAIVLWIYGSRSRSDKLEQHKHIPFLDDDENAPRTED
jgi:cbb3-type cytochrome oxidase subunit 3